MASTTDYSSHAADLLKNHPNGSLIRLQVTSGSMRPILQQGDIVVVQSIPATACTPGEIVVSQDADGLLTHRLLASQNGKLYTKGDATIWRDPPRAIDSLIGRVIMVERSGVRVHDFNKTLWIIGHPWLARLSNGEANLALKISQAGNPLSTLQNCLLRCIHLPLRTATFLLQWGA